MCFFGGSPKVPDAPPPPPAPVAVAPPPTVLPTEVSAQTAQADRQKQINRVRFGLSSTIKTGARGIAGAGPELQPQSTGKTTLG